MHIHCNFELAGRVTVPLPQPCRPHQNDVITIRGATYVVRQVVLPELPGDPLRVLCEPGTPPPPPPPP